MKRLKTRRSVFLFIVFLFAVTIYFSCKKSEQPVPVSVNTGNKTFFTVPENVNPAVTGIINALNRENEKFPFAETMVKNAGYPQWKYAVIRSNALLRSGSATDELINIPMVKEGDQKTSAILAVNISGGDTAYEMIYMQHYLTYPLDDSAGTSEKTAKDFFNVFANFDYAQFGTMQYYVNDGRIFGFEKKDTLLVTIRYDSARQSRQQPGAISGANASEITQCRTITSCVVVGNTTMREQSSLPGKEESLLPGKCVTTTNCTTIWWDSPLTSGPTTTLTGNNTPGTTTGGGGTTPATTTPTTTNSTSGNSTIPTLTGTPCARIAAVNARLPLPTDPCGTQPWVPVVTANSTEPIDSLLAKYSRLANKFTAVLDSLCESEHKERFYNIVNYNNTLDTFRLLVGESADEVRPNYNMTDGRKLLGCWHYHPKYPDGTPGSWPSGADVTQLYDKDIGFVMIIDTYTSRYAMVIEDKNKMQTWSRIPGNGSKIFPDKVAQAVLLDPRVYSTGSIYIDMTKEKIVTALGSSNSCGIGIYQASQANGTIFTKVN